MTRPRDFPFPGDTPPDARKRRGSRSAPARHLARWPSDGLIVTNTLGGSVSQKTLGDAWRKAARAAGLPKGTTFHHLRHYYASVLIAANIGPEVVQARLGHSSIAITYDVYGHLFPDAAEVGRGVIGARFSARSELTGS